MDVKAVLRDAGNKALEQSIKQWIGKAVLVIVPIIFMSGWQAFTRYKSKIILEPVRPELMRVNLRIDSTVKLIDTVAIEQKKSKRQNIRFQTVLVKRLGLENEIKRIYSEGRAKKAERAEMEDALEGLAE